MSSRLKIVLPLMLIVLAAVWYWMTPHASKEDRAWYASVFCAIDTTQKPRTVEVMRDVIEGGNSDYALHKVHFQPALGQQVVKTWQQLSAEQRASASASPAQCRETLTAALR